jgi:archaemetzincin
MIKLVPVGGTDKAAVENMRHPLEEAFDQGVQLGDRMELPSQSWNARRGQYLASAILDKLLAGDSVLGVVDVDIYAHGLNFVFGQADIAGRRALISFTRLRHECYGLPGDEEIFRERALKEAVHELGHTFGLGHCRHRACVMHFSNSLYDTDFKGWQFCLRCREKLKGR